MNKKYMDFVPIGGKNVSGLVKTKVVVPEKPDTAVNAKAKRSPRLTGSDVLGRGLIDAATRRAPVSHRPSKGMAVDDVNKKVDAEKEMKKATAQAKNIDSEKMKLPQARFVNTEKVAKRPLSKNVYQKKIVEPKEEPQGPVTIIHKPEKDSRVGLIVTIIITIILGAAAGTVAFLLIPK